MEKKTLNASQKMKRTPTGEIPVDWEYANLAKVLKTLESGMRPKGGVNAKTEGIPSFGGENIKPGGGVIYDNLNKITLEFYKSMHKGILRNNDILINKDGAWTGKLGFYNSISYEKAAINEHLFIIRGEPSLIIQKFLYYILLSPVGQNKLKRIITGSAQPGLNSSFAKHFLLPLPPLSEQKRIADILSSVDEAIEKTQAVIDQTVILKKGLMQELLTRGIPGRHKKYKKTEIGEIPEDWEVVKLANLLINKPEYGANSPANDYNKNLPRYIRITDISESGELLEDNIRSIDNEPAKNYLLSKGDFLFARSGATVGKTYLYDAKDGLCAFAGYLIRFKVNSEKLLPEFLFHITHGSQYLMWVEGILRAGAQPNINASEYSHFRIQLPSIEEQQEIIGILESSNKIIKLNQCIIEETKIIKSALMQVLLTGKVRVKV